MQIRKMNLEDIDSVLPLYIEYYNKYEDSCWTETTAKKRIKQVLNIDDSYSLIMKDDNDIVCGFVMGYFKQYDDIVNHYEKVLSKEDIIQITDDGQPIKKAQNILKNGMIGWSIAWILLVVGGVVVIDFVGDGPHIIESIYVELERFLSTICSFIKAQ